MCASLGGSVFALQETVGGQEVLEVTQSPNPKLYSPALLSQLTSFSGTVTLGRGRWQSLVGWEDTKRGVRQLGEAFEGGSEWVMVQEVTGLGKTDRAT